MLQHTPPTPKLKLRHKLKTAWPLLLLSLPSRDASAMGDLLQSLSSALTSLSPLLQLGSVRLNSPLSKRLQIPAPPIFICSTCNPCCPCESFKKGFGLRRVVLRKSAKHELSWRQCDLIIAFFPSEK